MKKAIILHGRPRKEEYFNYERPSQSNSHWLPWLQNQLIVNGIMAQAPEVYKPYVPRYENWAAEIDRYNPNKNTLLVGHSCGGGMIIQWLSKNRDMHVGKVVLVAPWIDIERDDWPAFDFALDGDLASRTKGLTIINSDDDSEEIQASVNELRKKLNGVKYMEFKNRGHFTISKMPDGTFPELLDECLKVDN
jgi:predicted alpha/beta hydrolase family esterase